MTFLVWVTCNDGIYADPYVTLPGFETPVFIDMPTDGTYVPLHAHDHGLSINGTAFRLEGDPDTMSYMKSLRFGQAGATDVFEIVALQQSSSPTTTSADAVPAFSAIENVLIRILDAATSQLKETFHPIDGKHMDMPRGTRVVCSNDKNKPGASVCDVVTVHGDELVISAQPATSKFVSEEEAAKHTHLNMKFKMHAIGVQTSGLLKDAEAAAGAEAQLE